jgi:hypothetical protein
MTKVGYQKVLEGVIASGKLHSKPCHGGTEVGGRVRGVEEPLASQEISISEYLFLGRYKRTNCQKLLTRTTQQTSSHFSIL